MKIQFLSEAMDEFISMEERNAEIFHIVMYSLVGATVAIAAVMIGYYFFYKKRVNQALRSGGKIKAPVLTPGGTAVTILVVMGIAYTIISILLLTGAMNRLDNINEHDRHLLAMSDEILTKQNRTFDQLVDQKNTALSQQLTDDWKLSYGSYHSEDNTVSLKISLKPRLCIGKNDKLIFVVGDSSAELKKDNTGRYMGEVRIATYAEHTVGVLILQTHDSSLTQLITAEEEMTLNGDWIYQEWVNYYPYVDCTVSNETKEGYTTSADVSFALWPSQADKSKTFTKLSVVFESDGQKLREVDLLNHQDVQHRDNVYTYHFRDAALTEEPITFTITGEDVLGYRYELKHYVLDEDKNGENNNFEDSDEERFYVYAPDGTLVIHSRYNPVNYNDTE